MGKKNRQSENTSRVKAAGSKATAGIPSASPQNDSYTSEKQSRVAPRAHAGITRQEASSTGTETSHQSPLRRAADSVRRLFSRNKKDAPGSAGGLDVETPIPTVSESLSATVKVGPKAPRLVRREADIPLDQLAESYTPPQTSVKTSFRSDGSDHYRDQEFSAGVADDVWNDEDRITNKSGDPRIGTHGRTYEPGESLDPGEKE